MSKDSAKPKASAKAKPKAATKRAPKGDDFAPLLAEVRQLLQSARHAAATTVNTLQVWTNFEIGRRIVEHQQKGDERAEYGTELLKLLSERLSEEFGRGFSPVNLAQMRKFFLTWRERGEIFQTASEKFEALPTGQTVSDQSSPAQIPQTPSAQLPSPVIRQTASAKSSTPFTLSWSHYVLLLKEEAKS